MSANTVKHDPLDDLPDPPLDSSPVRSNNTPFSVGESRSSVSGGMVHNVLDSADSHDLDFLVVDANVAAATYGSMDLTSMSSVPLSDQIPEGSPEHRPGHRKQLSTIPSESGDPQAHADLDEGDLSGHHRRTVSSGGVGQQLNSVVTTRGMPLATMEGDTEVGSPSSPTEDYMQELMASSTSAMQVPMRVLIKDPVKVESSRIGMRSTYFTYQVVTETGVSGQSSQKTLEVRRRFNDFVALHKVLKQHFRGYFIPPLPDKGFVDSKFSREGFLRVRQVDLQAYMRSIVQHPALRTSEAVRIFTTAEGELSSHSRWQQLSQSPPGALEGLKGAIMGDSAPSPAPSGSLASVRPGIAVRFKHIIQRKVEVSEEEIHLRQAKERFRYQVAGECGWGSTGTLACQEERVAGAALRWAENHVVASVALQNSAVSPGVPALPPHCLPICDILAMLPGVFKLPTPCDQNLWDLYLHGCQHRGAVWDPCPDGRYGHMAGKWCGHPARWL